MDYSLLREHHLFMRKLGAEQGTREGFPSSAGGKWVVHLQSSPWHQQRRDVGQVCVLIAILWYLLLFWNLEKFHEIIIF